VDLQVEVLTVVPEAGGGAVDAVVGGDFFEAA
jgi:hypothetical protein